MCAGEVKRTPTASQGTSVVFKGCWWCISRENKGTKRRPKQIKAQGCARAGEIHLAALFRNTKQVVQASLSVVYLDLKTLSAFSLLECCDRSS